MICPNCKSYSTTVIGSVQKDDYRRRRYKCVMCDFRFNTIEAVAPDRRSFARGNGKSTLAYEMIKENAMKSGGGDLNG